MCLSCVNTKTGAGGNMIGAYTVATNEPSWGIKRSNCERNSQRIKSEDLINSSFSTWACLQGFKLHETEAAQMLIIFRLVKSTGSPTYNNNNHLLFVPRCVLREYRTCCKPAIAAVKNQSFLEREAIWDVAQCYVAKNKIELQLPYINIDKRARTTNIWGLLQMW